MASSPEFYTYAYLRKSNGSPYYIGKGKGRRAFVKHKGVSTPKDKSKILFLKENITEEEAIKHEIYMISVFGRKDIRTGILLNRTNGGDGIFGSKNEKRNQIKGGNAAYKKGVGIHGLTKEEKSEFCKKSGKAGAAAQHKQRWQCTITEYISTPCGLSHYQKARGIDTTKRVRVL